MSKIIKLALVKPPQLSSYQDNDVKEDPILCSLLGYLDALGLDDNIPVFDFHVDKTVNIDKIVQENATDYVISVRDIVSCYRYAERVSHLLEENTDANIWIYGQVGPLWQHSVWGPRTHIVIQSERELAKRIGLPEEGPHFEKDLQAKSYFDRISLLDWQKKRMRAAIETSRGCPFRCSFCFINSGQNYEKRWQIKTNDQIIRDMKVYTDKGIRDFVFLDSEFFGARPADHENRKKLMERIIDELPPIKFKIWNRADTLMRFGNYDLLKRAGMRKVLIGVESFHQADLDAFNKGAKAENMIRCLEQLMENKIYGCLMFITFNQNTSVDSLRHNLDVLDRLFAHPDARYLGPPYFCYNVENTRSDKQEAKNELSNKTYISQLVWHRFQKDDKTCFDVALEPLMEIYRLMTWEWSMKKCELNHFAPEATKEEKESIDAWFKELGYFCLKMMRKYLNRFADGILTIETLHEQGGELFDDMKEYYSMLPARMQEFQTYDYYASHDYRDPAKLEDHGWDAVLPPSQFELNLEKEVQLV